MVVVTLSFGLLSFAGEVLIDGSGYQGLPWGSSLEQVKAKFPGITKAEGKDAYQLIREKQVILFCIGKDMGLWGVHVSYEPLLPATGKKVLTLLRETYGTATKAYGGEVGEKGMLICVWELKKGGVFYLFCIPSEGKSPYLSVTYAREEDFGMLFKTLIKECSIVPLKLIGNTNDVEL